MNELPSIFISYSSLDEEKVIEICRKLEDVGINVWLDKWGIKVGQNISKEVLNAISECDYFVIVLTKNSVKSRWVEEELTFAKIKEIEQNNTHILPLKFEDCEIPNQLKGKHYADFKNFEKGFDELLHFFDLINLKEKVLKKKEIEYFFKPTLIIGIGITGLNFITRIKELTPIAFRDVLPIEFISFNPDIDDIKPNSDLFKNIGSTMDWLPSAEDIFSFDEDYSVSRMKRRIALGKKFDTYKNTIDKYSNLISTFKEENDTFLDSPKLKVHEDFSVYIIASIFGGTGSGSLTDMAYLVRNILKDYKVSINGVCILPYFKKIEENPSSKPSEELKNIYRLLFEVDSLSKDKEAEIQPNRATNSKPFETTYFCSNQNAEEISQFEKSIIDNIYHSALGKESKLKMIRHRFLVNGLKQLSYDEMNFFYKISRKDFNEFLELDGLKKINTNIEWDH